MAPLRIKARRNGAGVGKPKKKLPVQGRGGAPRDTSSTGSSGSCTSRSGSEDDDSSSGETNSDEDDPRDYKKGGYHPVMPYQLYSGRYRVLSKLGAGAFSTVWLCADEKDVAEGSAPELVAMKVCKSKKSVTEQAEDEVALLETLQEGEACSPHVVQMRSHFWHSGPNGRHKGMVFEVMGENLLALVKHFDYRGLSISMVRRLARHTLLGLEYIHSRGVIHTDVKLENVLVQRHDMEALVSESQRAHQAFTEQKKGVEALSKNQKKRLKKKQKNAPEPQGKAESQDATKAESQEGKGDNAPLSKSQKKKMKKKGKTADAKGDADGGDSAAEEPAASTAAAVEVADSDDEEGDADKTAAAACGRPVPPVRQKERFKTFRTQHVFAKLADFGNGCRIDRKVTDDIQTRQYRSPEVIIGAHWDETADVWSAACMFFELITGDFLFDPRTGDKWSRDEDHLALIIELLGDYPSKDWALSGRYSRDFFNNSGKLKHIRDLHYWTLPGVLTSKYKMEEEEADEISSFLLPMLSWEPKMRCSASQALKHFWIKPLPGESDISDPDKLNSSTSSTEEGPASETKEEEEETVATEEAKPDGPDVTDDVGSEAIHQNSTVIEPTEGDAPLVKQTEIDSHGEVPSTQPYKAAPRVIQKLLEEKEKLDKEKAVLAKELERLAQADADIDRKIAELNDESASLATQKETTSVEISRHSHDCFCTAKRLRQVGESGLAVDFIAVGDSSQGDSQGDSQEPMSSTIFWEGGSAHPTKHTHERDAEVHELIEGTLSFEDVPKGAALDFEFGSSGYSRIRLPIVLE